MPVIHGVDPLILNPFDIQVGQGAQGSQGIPGPQGPAGPPAPDATGTVKGILTLSGDLTGTASNPLLQTVGTPGIYSKVTTDTKGRVISGGLIASGDVTTAIGYTPLNRNGDTMTGLLTLSGAPTTNLHASTKKYVDDRIATVGTSTTSVYGETPMGGINGSNALFTLANTFITLTTRVYLNGLRQHHGSTFDYTEGATNTITFISAPMAGDQILVDYQK